MAVLILKGALSINWRGLLNIEGIRKYLSHVIFLMKPTALMEQGSRKVCDHLFLVHSQCKSLFDLVITAISM